MPNIFDGLSKISDAELLDQIALLESINMMNISKPYVAKAKKGVISAINGVGKLFGKDFDIKKPEKKELVDYIEEKRKELSICTRSELDKKMLDDLVSKSRLGIKGSSLDAISVKVIEEASLIFKIPKDLTPSQKADSVYQRFLERMLDNMQKSMRKQNTEEIKKTEEALKTSLQGLSQKQREEITSALNVKELTGETVRQALLKAGAPAAILATISASGFGGFVALTTIIHAVFTTVLGITLPFAVYTSATSALAIIAGPVGFIVMFGVLSYQITNGGNKLNRELLAQIVWFAVNSYGNKFTPKDEELPSWVPLEKRMEVEKNEAMYKSLILDKELATKLAEESNEKLALLTENQRKQDILLKQERNNSILAKQKLNDLDLNEQKLISDRETAMEKVILLESKFNTQLSDNEENKLSLLKAQQEVDTLNQSLKKVNENSEYQKDIIESASEEIDMYIKNEINSKSEHIRLETENEELRSKAAIKDEKVEKQEECRRKNITSKWSSFFPDFKLDTSAIRNVVRFNTIELQDVEKALMELYYANDPKALSRGKIKENSGEYEHMALSFPDGFPTRILYKVLNTQSPKVEIVNVYKHNNKRFYQ